RVRGPQFGFALEDDDLHRRLACLPRPHADPQDGAIADGDDAGGRLDLVAAAAGRQRRELGERRPERLVDAVEETAAPPLGRQDRQLAVRLERQAALVDEGDDAAARVRGLYLVARDQHLL